MLLVLNKRVRYLLLCENSDISMMESNLSCKFMSELHVLVKNYSFVFIHICMIRVSLCLVLKINRDSQ